LPYGANAEPLPLRTKEMLDSSELNLMPVFGVQVATSRPWCGADQPPQPYAQWLIEDLTVPSPSRAQANIAKLVTPTVIMPRIVPGRTLWLLPG
jgi:hypothetical protein